MKKILRLNRQVLHHYKLTRFSNRSNIDSWAVEVLHHYKLTRFSNSAIRSEDIRQFYTITNLQGSQTILSLMICTKWFYTITNLQGSQTSNEIITEPNILVNMCKLPSNV